MKYPAVEIILASGIPKVAAQKADWVEDRLVRLLEMEMQFLDEEYWATSWSEPKTPEQQSKVDDLALRKAELEFYLERVKAIK